MIRILHYGLSSNLGGIETYLYKLYMNIDRTKYRFDFLINGFEKPYWHNEFTSMGSKFYHVTSRKKNPIKNRLEISKILKEENFDIIHCHLNSLSYTVPVHLALKHNYPVIVHSRNAGIIKSKASSILHKINRRFLPQHKITMLAVSDFAGVWMFGRNTDFIVINNGLNVEKYKFDIAARNIIRGEFGIKEEKVILHLGAMREQKNHMFILDVFSKIYAKDHNTKLFLLGDGSLKVQLLSKIDDYQIKDHVIIAGNRNDVTDVLSAADAFLFPSLYEGFPNAVLEAQTSGLPCLISDTITKEVVVNDNCHMLSLNKSADVWANKLMEITPFSDRSIGAQNTRAKGLSVEAEIKKIENIYSKMLSN